MAKNREESLAGARRDPNAWSPAGDPAGEPPDCASTGIVGLDAILGGGLPRSHAYLVQGDHGCGKTTLAMHFCLAGVERGERILYVTTCETESEVRGIARAHGWSLEGVVIHYLDARICLGDEPKQSVFHPVEAELPKTMDALQALIDRVDPQRLVIDSLSEIRLLAADSRWFRRQVLALKEDLAGRQCTTLLCDDRLGPEQPVKSIVHGVIELEQMPSDYGPDRRRLRVAKLRARAYASGYHDFKIRTGGLVIYPRLIAAEHRREFAAETFSSGVPELDALFAGGTDRGTAMLLLGPSGSGKSLIASQYAVASAERGERAAMYIFDERIQTLFQRAQGVGLGLKTQADRGLVEICQVDPAELSPGEFAHQVCQAVNQRGVRLVVIDSLTGYVLAMPNERMLLLHLHELLSYLAQQSVTVLMVMTQHGLAGGALHAPFDLSYVADSVLLFHTFEHAGGLRKAISVYKRRCGPHEATLRELQFGQDGICIGAPLQQFQGILTDSPMFTGKGLPDVRDQERH